MIFNSASFLIFFPIVCVLYFTIPHRFRWALLLLASVYFYSCFIPIYLLVLFQMICVDYVAGILMEKWQDQKSLKRLVFGFSLCSSLGLLFVFKYYFFVNENISAVARAFNLQYSIPSLKLILPLGISFHTFQSLSYIIEVYRGKQKAERHFGIFSLFIMFFPQLMAGPIERASHLLPQFREQHAFDYVRVTNGLKLMTWGFFQKLVIADRVSLYVNTVYSEPQLYTGLQLSLATFFFTFQIYCDFAGYTDIARGAAQVLGFRLMDNFHQPYLAHSFDEFWKRWHISLSTWFRDYVYFPLGGNRVRPLRHIFNLMFTFLLSGLWHGANWTFIVWGGLHGIFLILDKKTKHLFEVFEHKMKLARIAGVKLFLRTLLVFFLINLTWVYFRAENLSDAWYITTHLFGPGANWDWKSIGYKLEYFRHDYYIAFAGIFILLIVHWIQSRGIKIREWISAQVFWRRWAIYYTALFSIWFFGATDVKQFIYFQF